MALKIIGGGIPVWEFDINPLEDQLRTIIGLCQNQAKTFARIRNEHDVILKERVGEITETFPRMETGWPPGTDVGKEISKRYEFIEGRIGHQTTKLQTDLLKEIDKFKQELNSQIEALKRLVPKI